MVKVQLATIGGARLSKTFELPAVPCCGHIVYYEAESFVVKYCVFSADSDMITIRVEGARRG